MKKIYLSFLMAFVIGIGQNGFSQCLTTVDGKWPSADFTPACNGNAETIVTDGYAGEYSVVNVTAGTQYTFSSSVATDYITIADNPATTTAPATTSYATGTGSVTWTSTLTGKVRFITHTNSSCGNAQVNRARRVQCGNQAANDVAVLAAYSYGTAGRGTQAVVRAYVSNLGSNAANGKVITLNVTGANTHTSTVTVNIPSGTAGFVTFPLFTLTNAGTNTILVSIPADDNNTNNDATTTQEVTTNQLSYAVGTTASGTVNLASGGELASKFGVPYANTVTQVNVNFSAAMPFDLIIYPNVGSAPGSTPLYTQTGLTSTVGMNNLTLTSPVAVSDSFWVAIRQTTTTTGLNFQTESPLRTGAFFYKSSTGTYGDVGGGTSTTFRPMVGVTFGAALPVTISDFKGQKENASNLLTWTTTTESNNRGFELQRSADGVNFSPISFIASKAEGGNSNSILNYKFTDARTLAGTNYYRLQQIDLDGKTSYSSIVILKGDKAGLTISAAYPNPTKESVRIIVSSPLAEKANISVTDINGKVVNQLSSVLVAGENNININVSFLAAGTYYIRLVAGSEVKTTQFIKQ